ncbi:MAG TPA: energy transducer TonB, partial [Bryobacteraceae bacterium]|nr:energy transducer TonB [Bryobacteraceae bacterium]
WNRNSPAVRNAKEGILEINDGPDDRQIRLSAAEMATGSILYLPTTDDVVFRLEVHGAAGQSMSETMRILGNSKATVLDARQPSIPPDNTPDVRPASPTARMPGNQLQVGGKKMVDASRLVPIQPRHKRSRTQDLRAANRSVNGIGRVPDSAPAQSSADLHPASTPRGATADAPVSGAPSGNSSQSNSKPANQVAENMAPPSAPPVRQTADSSSSDATPGSPAEQTHTREAAVAPVPAGQIVPAQMEPGKGSAPQIPTPAQAEPKQVSPPGAQPVLIYRPPRPVKQVLPKISDLQPAGLADSAGELSVLVKVNESGRVVDARLVEGKKKFGPILRSAALIAARQWVFEPASLHGKSIASEHTIVFQFRH